VLALVTGRLDLDPESQLFHGGAERTVVITHASADAEARDRLAAVADVVVAGDHAVDLATALDRLAERGLSRVLCEGGPSLLASVAAAGRLDELCLTLAPQLVGGDGPRVVTGPHLGVPLSLAHLLEQDSVLLSRYVAG
jgi:riboflavin biosynthesis pyrimidine reductase